MTKIDYDQQASDFLEKTKTSITSEFLKNDYHFKNDTNKRDIYLVTITRGRRSFSFNFGQSVVDSQYYQDRIPERTYSLCGKSRTGNYSINDLSKYQSGGQQLTLKKGKTPTEYDILACLIKSDPGSLEDFCSNFGYDADSKTAEEIYEAIKQEWKNVQVIWTDEEISKLQEIE
jgi:hypothetical protein